MGVWNEVATKLEQYKLIAKKTRNPDASFSIDYFKRPANGTSFQKRMGTTGHVLEWLSLYLPDDEINASWMQESANALAVMMLESQNRDIEGGALYHAAHGLHLYHARVFGDAQSKGPLPPPPKD